MRSQDQAADLASPTPANGAAPWRPLLSGEVAEAALRTASAIVPEPGRPGLAGAGPASLSAGSAGLAVCHAMFARAGRDEQAAARSAACLDDAISAVAAQRLTAGLYSGFTGIAWAVDLVSSLLADGNGDRNEGIDVALARLLSRELGEHAPYDLINGLTGLGVYALARWPRDVAGQCLAAVVDQLASRARRDGDGICWWTSPLLLIAETRERFPRGGIDVGVAHGMAGVLPLLARAHALGVAPETARGLLDGAVRWLLGHLVVAQPGRTAPSFLAEGEEPGPCRTAWCYGDPGVAAALLLAARDAGEPEWEQAATELALGAAARPYEQTGVSDAGLCHGTAGLAHLFNRMYQLTGEERLADAARGWASRTLSMCEHAAAEPSARPPWTGPGLLEGAAGVALALLAASTAEPPVWDQMLLVTTGGPAGVCPR